MQIRPICSFLNICTGTVNFLRKIQHSPKRDFHCGFFRWRERRRRKLNSHRNFEKFSLVNHITETELGRGSEKNFLDLASLRLRRTAKVRPLTIESDSHLLFIGMKSCRLLLEKVHLGESWAGYQISSKCSIKFSAVFRVGVLPSFWSWEN